ncbi:cell envelope integrity protein TolA [Cupriavidus malaysiensis]|uniref:Protein TolA n=1 Tax=Cupriavidus malaysiensis TaxID=367825 RepID=A0ABN4TTJ3_9BURK|nr:cell envelope integrity protein TolA [Cupriavidus malaysiensis]AOZ10558.1 protein TolA [Cupriavidus malaysiensis]
MLLPIPPCSVPRLPAALSLLAAVLLAGCAPATVVQTNHASDYVARPGRIYVATGAGMGWGSEFSQAFQQKFQEIVGACGNTAGFVELSGLELDQRTPVQRAADFRADTLLTIAHGGGVVMMGGGNRISIHYLATLGAMQGHRPVWRGSFDFGRGGTVIPLAERGAVFAVDLTNGLIRDHMLPGCREIALGQGSRLEGAGAGTAGRAAPSQTEAPVASVASLAAAPAAAKAPPPATGQASLQDLDGLLPAAGAAAAPMPAAGTGTSSARAFADAVRRRVRPNVRVDAEIAGNPAAVVMVELRGDGSLLQSRLVQSSGDARWDTAVMRAVALSAPFPLPDDGRLPTRFTITFRPKD